MPSYDYLASKYNIADWERANADVPVETLAEKFLEDLKANEKKQLLQEIVTNSIDRTRRLRLVSIARSEARRSSRDSDRAAFEVYREGLRARIEQRRQELHNSIRAEVRLEITNELLKVSFAGRNGKRVTWGKATAEDHFARIEHLLTQAKRDVDETNKHQSAIDILTECGAETLSEVHQAVVKAS